MSDQEPGRTSDHDGLTWPAMSSPVDAGVTELDKVVRGFGLWWRREAEKPAMRL